MNGFGRIAGCGVAVMALAGCPMPAGAQFWTSWATAPRAAQPSGNAAVRAATTKAAPTAPATRASSIPVAWEVFGRTVENRVLEFAQFGSGPKRVLVVGGLRGDEPEGVAMAQALAEHLTRFPQRIDDVRITIVRDPNPDGRTRRWPGNARGVELDRNFPAKNWRAAISDRPVSGHMSDSELETRALVDLLADVQPDRVIVLGTSAQQTTLSYTGPADQLAVQLAPELLAALAPYDLGRSAGSLASLTGIDRKIPTLWIGFAPRSTADAIWSAHRRGLLTAVGCGTRTDFVRVSHAKPPQGSPSAATTHSKPQATGPDYGPRTVATAASTSVAAQPAVAADDDTTDVQKPKGPEPLYFNELKFGRPAVQVVSPRAKREGSPQAPPEAPRPNVAATPDAQPTIAPQPVADPRVQRLPPINVFAPPARRPARAPVLPQRPIPAYPQTAQ